MTTTIALSVGIVFLAELGDKSQLMALSFALRYRWWVALGGIATAAAAIHLMSVTVGHFLGAALPTRSIALVAAVIFLVVGIWTLREHASARSTDQDKDAGAAAGAGSSRLPRTAAAPFLVVLSAFLLAELGDRTMFATAALATDYEWAGVWIGSTIGMVIADALAIAVGILIGKHLPEHTIGIGAALLFLFFGALTGIGAMLPDLGGLLSAALASTVPLIAGVALVAIRRRSAGHRIDPSGGHRNPGAAYPSGDEPVADDPEATRSSFSEPDRSRRWL